MTLVLAVAIGLLVVPAAAAKSIEIAPGDTVDVAGTKVLCFAVSADGKKGIGCFLAAANGFIPGTYGSQLSEAGDAVVSKVNANGSSTAVWQHRSKASARTAVGKYYKVNVGDTFGFTIKGGSVGCTVFAIATGGPKYAGRRVVCFRAVKTKPVPKSYGLVVSDKFAGSLRFDAKGNVGPTTFVRFQPR
jgi:hypothetical protein